MQSLVLEQCDAFALSQRKRCQCNAYRAPGSPIAAFGVESVIDELAAELDIDPIEFEPFSLAELASKAALTGGPIAVQTSVNAQGPGPAFATHICDVEGLRLGELPMSPPKVLAALAAKGETRTPELTASVNPQDRWPRASDGAFAAHIDCASRGTM